MEKSKKKIVIKKKEREIPANFKKELNEEQLKVIQHEKGPTLIIAGAGSGKTRTITYRVGYLLHNGVDPSSIILVTFTKKAAQEMINRLEKLVGAKARGIYAGTFHHLANMVLRKYAKLINFENNFTILDPTDQKSLMKLILSEQTPEKLDTRFPKADQLVNIYSKRINLALKLKTVIQQEFPQYIDLFDKIDRILQNFIQRKQANNLMDFDDLLVYLLAFLKNDEISEGFKRKISHVLVDEYQDVNGIQSKIVDELAIYSDSLLVVGDDAQAIYKFRGSDFQHMLNFEFNHPGAIIYKLETNYRSSPEILNLANASIKFNEHQYEKNLHAVKKSNEKPMMIPCKDLEQEAKMVCQLILDYRDQGISLCEQAVLFRATFNSLSIEQELTKENIPYEMRAGIRFFERAHIKDLLAYLCIIVNPKDQVQWIRILSMHQNISDLSAQKIISLFSSDLNSLEEFCKWNLKNKLKGMRIQLKGIDNLSNLQNFFKSYLIEEKSGMILSNENLPPISELLDNTIKYIEPLMKEKYKTNFEDRIRDLGELRGFAASYSDISSFLGDILTQYNIQGETIGHGNPLNEEKPLILSTIHSAKGLEWKVVFLINLVEGRMPNSRAIGDSEKIEEERRLFYVASTRAEDHLILSYPLFIPYQYNDNIGGPSRFLEEIKKDEVYEEVEVEEE